MKLGILSDSHDNLPMIEAALEAFRARGVERIIHCGDVTGSKTVMAFAGWEIDFTLGNCDWSPESLESAIREIGGRLHPTYGELELAGKRIAWTHSHDARLLSRLEHSGDYDLLCYGHTHVAEEHWTGKTLVLNPGALQRAIGKRAVVMDMATGERETIDLGK